MVGFRFTKCRGNNAAGRTNPNRQDASNGPIHPGESPNRLFSEPLTESRLTRLMACLKRNLGREQKPPQNPHNVVVDLDSFFTRAQTPPPPPEDIPTPTLATPVSTTWSEIQQEWMLYNNHFRRQHNQSQSASSWTTTSENSVIEPYPSGRSRQVDDSGDLQGASPIRPVSPDPVDLFFQLFWANEAQKNPPLRASTASPSPTQNTAGRTSPEPMGLFYQLFWANNTMSHVNSTPELSEGSGSADTDFMSDFTEWMLTPSGNDHEANERFFGPTYPMPATPVLRPSSPTDPFLSPSGASQGPARLRDFSLPPPMKPVVHNTDPPVRPPRPPSYLCPPPIPSAPSIRAQPDEGATAGEALLQEHVQRLWHSDLNFEQQEAS